MILLWGVPGDAPLDSVRAALEQAGAYVRLLDQREATEIQTNFKIAANGTASGKITDSRGEIDLSQVGSAYVRPLETSKASAIEVSDHPLYLKAVATDASMIAWANLSHAIVVNRPAMMAANNSKPYQLGLIAACGFKVPDTLVTTDESAARRFRERHGSVVYKSVSGIRSVVSRLKDAQMETLGDIANCPTQFQEYIAGTDVRVHVAGHTVLATEIVSAADDYRYASRTRDEVQIAPTELPPHLANQCREMVRSMGLHLAGIDFRRGSDGAWYCLEVNPSPGFTYFESATGQPIGAAVADLLVSLDQSVRQANCTLNAPGPDRLAQSRVCLNLVPHLRS